MLLGALSCDQLSMALSGDGIRITVGSFIISVRGNVPEFVPILLRCYTDYCLSARDTFADARIAIERESSIFKKRALEGVIRLNDGNVYTQFPLGSELPYMEWGIILCIATRAHQFLMLHAGVLEKHGVAMLLPGLPGSGKSTLSAFLMHRGWRLLSDEFTLLTGPELKVHPFPRLVPLKNESIEVIRDMLPEAKIGPLFEGTPKGTVAHVCPPATHIARMGETATPRLIIFPRYVKGAETQLVANSKPGSFVELTKHAFNYILRGKSAFETTTKLVDRAGCYRLTYSKLEEAESRINELVENIDGARRLS